MYSCSTVLVTPQKGSHSHQIASSQIFLRRDQDYYSAGTLSIWYIWTIFENMNPMLFQQTVESFDGNQSEAALTVSPLAHLCSARPDTIVILNLISYSGFL